MTCECSFSELCDECRPPDDCVCMQGLWCQSCYDAVMKRLLVDQQRQPIDHKVFMPRTIADATPEQFEKAVKVFADQPPVHHMRAQYGEVPDHIASALEFEPPPNIWREMWNKPMTAKNPFRVGDIVIFKDAANKKDPQRYVVEARKGHDHVVIRQSGSDTIGMSAPAKALEYLSDYLARCRRQKDENATQEAKEALKHLDGKSFYENECHNDNHDPGCTCGAGRIDDFLARAQDNPHHHQIRPDDYGEGGEVDAYTETWFAEAQRIVNGDRAVAYGETTGGPEDTTVKIARAWSAYLGVEVTPGAFCDLMMLLKLMRDSHKPKRDSNVDIAGYLLLKERHVQEN